MKTIIKDVFLINGKNTEGENVEQKIYEEEKANYTLEFLKEFIPERVFTMVKSKDTLYEIEKGDKIHWIKNGILDNKRIDTITKVTKDMFGTKRYMTKELNGNKIGAAYEQDIKLIMEVV